MLKLILVALAAMLISASSSEARQHRHHHKHHQSHARSVTTAGLVPKLAAKVAEIKQACGSTLVSGKRHTLIAGTRHMSLHASGRAADVSGNPSCIYAHLKGWTSSGGGYTNDYGIMRHVHISLGGREAGQVFAHGRADQARFAGGSRFAGYHQSASADRFKPF